MHKEAWVPAMLATEEHVLRQHKEIPYEVISGWTKVNSFYEHAGQIIAVRLFELQPYHYPEQVLKLKEQMGCKGQLVEVLPDDVQRLWPNYTQIVLCTCQALMD